MAVGDAGGSVESSPLPSSSVLPLITLEEWRVSASTKLSKTATLTADSSSLNILRSGSRWSEIRGKILEAFVPEANAEAEKTAEILEGSSRVLVVVLECSSVTPDYVPFQIWDSLQGLSTYIRSMLSTQALLSAIGVGEKSATVIGATFQGSNLDSNAKMWRLVADFMNDLGRARHFS
ncbi:hypothetical protein IEQ34_020795 [Dendrobium chrysotoxum]|uniref:Protein root UVB sensitive/RUS domain-containing protein n=1 Tax=Dendrobium chrysotoxum TaxID=161865 RepID=A0AAV7G333_DENCH|nr:hypothetical protein IEQ34_020795 [Dendrobium chrysotoxum]